MSPSLSRSGAALLFLIPAAVPTFAANPAERPTHEFSLGVTRQTADTSALASSASLPEVRIDLQDLNVDGDHDSWFAQYNWRFGKRWLLGAFAYQYNDSGRVTVSETFNYDGVEFGAGAVVDSTLEIDTYAVDVLYAVHQGERSELLVGGGIHALDLQASFRGLAVAADEFETFSVASDSLLAPVPNLRAQGTYAFNDRISADLTAGWLSANIDAFEGSFAYAHARLRYRLTKRGAIALGYQFTAVDVSHNSGSGNRQKFDADLGGPSLQIIFGF